MCLLHATQSEQNNCYSKDCGYKSDIRNSNLQNPETECIISKDTVLTVLKMATIEPNNLRDERMKHLNYDLFIYFLVKSEQGQLLLSAQHILTDSLVLSTVILYILRGFRNMDAHLKALYCFTR